MVLVVNTHAQGPTGSTRPQCPPLVHTNRYICAGDAAVPNRGMAGALGPEGHWTEFLVHYRVTEVTQELQGAIKSDTQENRVFVFFCFLVCVNLIIQIFIYTVRKNLLIFISSQAPRGPTMNTHPACLLHASVQEEAAAKPLQHSPRETEKAGWGGEPAYTSGAWQPHHPLLLGLTFNSGRCSFLHLLPSLASLGPH